VVVEVAHPTVVAVEVVVVVAAAVVVVDHVLRENK
jgi:hypothetical protein